MQITCLFFSREHGTYTTGKDIFWNIQESQNQILKHVRQPQPDSETCKTVKARSRFKLFPLGSDAEGLASTSKGSSMQITCLFFSREFVIYITVKARCKTVKFNT